MDVYIDAEVVLVIERVFKTMSLILVLSMQESLSVCPNLEIPGLHGTNT